ncbi:MAG: tetratricopeptide repeat protein [Bacteroidota bacterium]
MTHWIKLALAGVLLTFHPLCAQQKADSLRQVLATLQKKDTNRVAVLNKLAYELVFTQPAESELLANESIELADRLDFHRGVAHGYQVLGIAHDIRGNYQQGIEANQAGLERMQRLDMNNRTIKELYGALSNGLALGYYHQSSYQQALEIFLDALRVAEELNNKVRLANVYNNIGLVYHDLKDFDKALDYYKDAMRVADEAGAQNISGRAANNAGLILREKGDLKEALRYYELSLESKKKLGDDNGISATYQNMSVIYKWLNDLPKALDYVDRAIEIKTKLSDKLGLVQAQDTKADLLMMQKKFGEAQNLIANNQTLVGQMGTREPMLLVYDAYATLYRELGQFDKALEWHVKKTELNDSLFNEAKSKQIAELETKYQVEKKEQEIERLESEREYQNLRQVISIALIAVLVAFIAMGWLWFSQKQRQDKMYFEAQQALARAEIVNAQLREEELKKELDYKNRELTSYTVNFIQKSKLMEEMKETLSTLKETPAHEVSKKIVEINKIIDSNYQVDKEWEDFRRHFEKVHPDFFDQLKLRFPDLTGNDLKLCALLKLNMNMKESAKILGISPDSVKTARYRLRKKLNLAKEEALFDFMFNIENDPVVAE